jgi:polysaccharide biosynthesis protein PslH
MTMDTTTPSMFMLMPYVAYPVDRGAYQRVYHLFVELSHAFKIDLVCLREEADRDRDMAALAKFTARQREIPFCHPPWPTLFPDRLMHPMPTTVRHWQAPTVLPQIQEFIGGRHYDYIYFFDLVMWPYVEALFPHHPNCIMDRSRVDWLFQSEELRTLRLRPVERLLRRENLLKIGRMERQVYRGLRDMIVCGWDDKTFLRQRLGEDDKVFVLANGYNPELFDTATWPRQPSAQPTILFCGALDYSPNVDGIEWFLRCIWPQILAKVPTARWRIVGKSPGARAREWAAAPGVELVGEVPDVRPYYQSCWLQVVPLRIGGGTRLKIVESLAMQCPVVSTTLGAQGLALQDGYDITLADSEEAIAQAVISLCRAPASLTTLGAQGEATVRAHYRWDQLGALLIQHLRNRTSGGPAL